MGLVVSLHYFCDVYDIVLVSGLCVMMKNWPVRDHKFFVTYTLASGPTAR